MKKTEWYKQNELGDFYRFCDPVKTPVRVSSRRLCLFEVARFFRMIGIIDKADHVYRIEQFRIHYKEDEKGQWYCGENRMYLTDAGYPFHRDSIYLGRLPLDVVPGKHYSAWVEYYE